VVSYSTVDSIKNISLLEDVFASLFRNLDKNYPVTWRDISAIRLLNAVDRMQDGNGGLEAHMTQNELKNKMLEE